MPIDNDVKMQDRSQNFTEFRKSVSDFENFIQNTDVLKFAHRNRKNIQEITNSSYIWGIIKLFAKNIFSVDFWKIVLNAPIIYRIYKNYDKPEMQKLLVEETSLLEQIGINNEITKELINDLVFTKDDKRTTLLKQIAGATIDLLHNEDSRNKLKIELANSYFKFSLNSFDRQSFIDNFVEYEKTQITNKIKDENDLVKLLKEKSDIRLGDSNSNLKNIIKPLVADASKTEISDTLKIQLRRELEVLGLDINTINKIIPDAMELSLQDAQNILQNKYNEVLSQKIGDIHNNIRANIEQHGSLNNFDNYVTDILRKHAQYIVNVQEPLYQENYIKEYIRFNQENDSTKSVDELRDEAIQNSYNIAPDYMRLTQNVLRIIDAQESGIDGNLKGVLRTRGQDLVNFVKDYSKEQKIITVLDKLGMKSTELTELSTWIRDFDVANNKTLQETIEHILTVKLQTEIPDNLQEIINSPQTQTVLDMLNNFGVDNDVLDLVPLVLGEPDKLANITESIRTKFVFNWAEDLLNLLNSNAELRQKFIDKPKIATQLTNGIVNNIPFLKNLCQDLGCTDQVFDIISILIKTPEETQKILEYLNEGRYIELAQKFIKLADSNEELKNYLTSHKDTYKLLISSLFKEIDLMRNLKDDNGITNQAVGEILDNALSILDNPSKFTGLINVANQIFDIADKYIVDKGLGEFSNMQKEDYVELTKMILRNEDLFKLLDENKVALGNFAEFLIDKIPTLRDFKQSNLAEIDIKSTLGTLINRDILKHDRLVSNITDAIKTENKLDFIKLLPRHLFIAAQKGPKILRQYFSSPNIKGELAALIEKLVNSSTFHNSLSELLQASSNADLVNFGNTKNLSGIVLDNTDFSKIKKIQGFVFLNSNIAKSKFTDVIIDNSSFNNVTFQKGVTFENSSLYNVDFSNAKFSCYKIEELYLPRRTEAIGKIETNAKISFKNSVLKNVNFSNIKIIKSTHYSDNIKLDFEGAIIDRSTLNSLVKAIKADPSLVESINLRGARIVGDMSELDLSRVNLEGTDLSGISNLSGTIVKDANLKNTRISLDLLSNCIQLENLQTDFTQEQMDAVIRAQKEQVEVLTTKKIAGILVNKLINDGKLSINIKDTHEVNKYISHLSEKLLREIRASNGTNRNYLINIFVENYFKLDKFMIDSGQIKHFSDLSSEPQVILNSLYDKAFLGTNLTDQNLVNILKYDSLKNLIADEIGNKLFGEGQNRGKDFIIIRQHLTKIFDQLTPEEKQNLFATICSTEHDAKNDKYALKLNNSVECEILLNSLKNKYYSKTKYTSVGIATSGVYLPTSDALDEFVSSDLNAVKAISDLEQIKKLSNAVGQKIGQKLFGDSMSSSRELDTQKIITYLNDQIFPHILCSLPREEKEALLDSINYEESELVDKLVGDFNKVTMLGMKKVDANSLSQIFYNATSHTKVGSVTGGLQLNHTKLDSQYFFDKVSDCVIGKCTPDLLKIEELAEKIGNKLGDKLFGEDASISRKADIQKIVYTLNKIILPNVINALSSKSEKENFLNATDAVINNLVGDYTKSTVMGGFWSKSLKDPTTLAQIFYDNSSYTKVGLASGGIQLANDTLESKPFLDKVENYLKTKTQIAISINTSR